MAPTNPPDDSIHHAVAGDVAALTKLLTATRQRLRVSLARRIPAHLARVVDVEDVVQEAHTQAFRNIKQLEPRSTAAFYRWLARIAERRLFDAIKREMAKRRGGGQRALRGSSAEQDSLTRVLEDISSGERTSRIVATREAAAQLRRALVELPAPQRTVLRRIYLDGASAVAVAGELGRTADAVRALRRRGIQALRERLDRDERAEAGHA